MPYATRVRLWAIEELGVVSHYVAPSLVYALSEHARLREADDAEVTAAIISVVGPDEVVAVGEEQHLAAAWVAAVEGQDHGTGRFSLVGAQRLMASPRAEPDAPASEVSA